MKPSICILLAVVGIGVVLACIIAGTRIDSLVSHSKAPRPSATSPTQTAVKPAPHFDAKNPREALADALAELKASTDPERNRAILAELRRLLDSLPPAEAAQIVEEMLVSGQDAGTALDVKINADGTFAEASSFRVFLMDYLAKVDPSAAGTLAVQTLAHYTTPDEWAVSLRNYAWANPGDAGHAFLVDKAKELLANPAWLKDPSTGFLEAFDAIVYARGTTLAPQLCGILAQPDQPAAAHAAYLTLDRLTLSDPTAMLQQLVSQPDLMKGHEQTRANFVARADVSQPDQRALVEQYLLDPSRNADELATFAGLYPNANYMISQNMLTPVTTPTGAQLAVTDRAALQTIEQWQKDPRFQSIAPTLAKIHDRLATFVQQAASQ